MNEDRISKVLNMKLKRKCPRGRSRWEHHLQKKEEEGEGTQKGN
jgi:hypothetical protein